jgi:hypothetical protein
VYRLEKAIQRLEGVDKVRVHMEPTRAEITPRAGVWIEADRLRGTIKKAGFKAGDILLTLTGTLTEWQDQPALRVTLNGSERLVVLQADARTPEPFEQARQALPQAGSTTVQVEGQLVDRAAGGDKGAPPALRVTRVEISH